VKPRAYTTPDAFKAALDQRLRNVAEPGVGITRRRHPPLAWDEPYAAMSAEDDLPRPTMSLVTAAARAFLDPVLAGGKGDRWSPATWTWAPER